VAERSGDTAFNGVLKPTPPGNIPDRETKAAWRYRFPPHSKAIDRTALIGGRCRRDSAQRLTLMNDPNLLRMLHLAGVIGLFTAIGAIMLAGSGRKGASALHGISLLLILLSGFAILQKPPMTSYWWMAKLGIWLFIGVAPALVKRKVLPAWQVLGLCLAGGIAAIWLGRYKPF
jgi:hypothetical protein